MKHVLETEDLTLGYGEEIIIDELDLQLPKGEITVFVGGNGAGKSTLLRSLARLLKPKTGSIILDKSDISKLSTKELAKKMAILPQGPTAPEELTVLQLVKQGRYPHQNWLQQWSKEDERMVNKALADTQLTKLADKPVNSLSGGQRQRAWIAMVLAQGTDTILLDEPTTYLDMAHQIEVLDLLFELNQAQDCTIIMVLHDLNLACRYADHIVALNNKEVVAQGTPQEVMTAKLVESVFDMQAKIIEDPLYETPMCIPFSKHVK
ncbi:ABC transporter ATP-binding protein [Halanaerocella petrolearia]